MLMLRAIMIIIIIVNSCWIILNIVDAVEYASGAKTGAHWSATALGSGLHWLHITRQSLFTRLPCSGWLHQSGGQPELPGLGSHCSFLFSQRSEQSAPYHPSAHEHWQVSSFNSAQLWQRAAHEQSPPAFEQHSLYLHQAAPLSHLEHGAPFLNGFRPTKFPCGR